MSDDVPNALMLDIKVALARIEERQNSAGKEIASLRETVNTQFSTYKSEVDHKLKNLQQADMAFMPSREVEQKLDAVKAHCDANREILSGRVASLEDHLRHYSRWAIGMIGVAGLGVVASFWNIISKKIGL